MQTLLITVVAILISDKVGFRPKNVARCKQHFIMTKVTIQQENVILNVYADKNKTSEVKTDKLRHVQIHNYS